MSNALKTINDKKFNDVFIEITHSEDLGTTNNKELRLFRMKEIIDNEFSKDALNKFVSRNIGHYVFSRSKVKEYYDEDDEMSAGVEALDLMWATGDADQKGTGNELGEVLLYAFLESVLDAPKIYSKVELNRTVRSGNSNDGWRVIGTQAFANARFLRYTNETRSAVMVMHGEKAHSRYFGEDAFNYMVNGNPAAGIKPNPCPENKQLLIVPGATHCDLYDGGNGNFIPWDKLEEFFKENLK